MPARAEERFAAQLRRGLTAAIRQRGGTVTLRLEPEALGQLKIRMKLQQGKVEASFEVGSDQARRLLEKTKDTLRSALEAKGLAVDRLEVQVSPKAAEDAPAMGKDPDGSGAGSEHPGGGGDPQRPARTPVEPRAEESADQGRDEPWMGDSAGGALRLDALA